MSLPLFYLSFIALAVPSYVLKIISDAQIGKIDLLIIGYLFYLILHIALISQINLFELLDINYFRSEGRIFFSFIPFLFFSKFSLSKKRFYNICHLFYYVFATYGILILIDLITPLDLNFLFFSTNENNSSLFKGFFSTKNAAGNFIGVFLSTSFFFFKKISFRTSLIILLGFLPFLFASSRQGYISFFFSMIYLLFYSSYKINFLKYFKKYFSSVLVICLLILISVFFDILLIERFFRLNFSNDNLGSNFNILWRLNAWSDSLNYFIQSPFFGIGVNRFGDFSKVFIGQQGLAYFAVDGILDWKRHYIHPHNLYLTILAEQGLFGFIFFISIFYKLYNFYDQNIPKNREIAELGKVVLIYTFFSGTFGNGLEAPSAGIPFGLFCGICYSVILNKGWKK